MFWIISINTIAHFITQFGISNGYFIELNPIANLLGLNGVFIIFKIFIYIIMGLGFYKLIKFGYYRGTYILSNVCLVIVGIDLINDIVCLVGVLW